MMMVRYCRRVELQQSFDLAIGIMSIQPLPSQGWPRLWTDNEHVLTTGILNKRTTTSIQVLHRFFICCPEGGGRSARTDAVSDIVYSLGSPCVRAPTPFCCWLLGEDPL